MTDKQFYALFCAALASADRDAFVSDWALSSVWADQEDAEIPPERIAAISDIWSVAHATIRDIRAYTGLTQAAFSTRFCIPRRTLENWESGVRSCPDYVRLLLAQAAGMYARPEG